MTSGYLQTPPDASAGEGPCLRRPLELLVPPGLPERDGCAGRETGWDEPQRETGRDEPGHVLGHVPEQAPDMSRVSPGPWSGTAGSAVVS